MDLNMIIVLLILAFMVISMLFNIFPYGVTAMICCVAFVLTGVCDIQTAFSGLSSKTTIMVASMIVVAQALGRTSLADKLKNSVNGLKGKKGIVLLLSIFILTILLSQIMGQIAALTIMLIVIQTLGEEDDMSASRILFAVVVINCIWTSRIPVGMGATMPFSINSFYTNLVGESYALGILDYFKAGIIPSIVGTIYCLLFYKAIPKSKITNDNAANANVESNNISKRDNYLIFLVFIVVTLGFMFQSKLGDNVSNILPAACVLFLIIFKVLKTQEVVKIVSQDMVWMIAGMQVMSNVLGKTGVGTLIGESVLKVIGNSTNSLYIILVFVVVTVIMTNFLSNIGTMALMSPIAASTALVAGMDVKTVVLAVNVSAWFAFVMPTACAGAIMGFGIGNHNPFKLMKFTLPLVVLLIASLILGLKLFY